MLLLNLCYILVRRYTLDKEKYGYICYSRYSRNKELEGTVGMYICDVITSGATGFLIVHTIVFPISSEEKNVRPLISVLLGRNHINSQFRISDIRHNFAILTGINNCQSDPCGLRGTCVDQSDSYHCVCDVGYTGYNCNLSICEDNSSPCENNSTCGLCEEGVCNSTGLSFQCNCVDDFYGVLCHDRKLLKMIELDTGFQINGVS